MTTEPVWGIVLVLAFVALCALLAAALAWISDYLTRQGDLMLEEEKARAFKRWMDR